MSKAAVLFEQQITAKPATMPWEVAGGFSAGAQTAHISVAEIGVDVGDTVLVHGAAGAVGTIAVQLSRLRGATVIGAARAVQHDHVRSPATDGIDAAIDGEGGEALDATRTHQAGNIRGKIVITVP